MKFFAIEGNRQRLDGGAMFGNAPRAVWEKWIQPDERNRIVLACRSLLCVTDSSQVVLFETGIGGFFDPVLKDRFGVEGDRRALLTALENCGVKESDVSAVVLSHLHFDHAGGLLSDYEDGPLRLLFPKARYLTGARHWQRAKSPHLRDRASFVPELNTQLEASGRLVLITDGQDLGLGPEFSAFFTDGHTLGLMHAEIQTAQGPLVFASDLIPGLPWIHLPITMGYDRSPETLVDEKRALLQRLVANNGSLFLIHDPATPCARVRQDAKGKFFGEVLNLSLLS